MKRFIEGDDRSQSIPFPASLDDYVAEDNLVRVIDAFVDTLNLARLGFDRALPADTGRPSYHPSILLKIYIYGYLNRIQSSRRLEREAQRNVELMWLTGRLAPDFKTIADFRKDNGEAIRGVCRQFVQLCHRLNIFESCEVAIDGSKFKAVNNRDKNYTQNKLKARIEQVEESIARYMEELDRADRQPELSTRLRVRHIKDKIPSVTHSVWSRAFAPQNITFSGWFLTSAVAVVRFDTKDEVAHAPLVSTQDARAFHSLIFFRHGLP